MAKIWLWIASEHMHPQRLRYESCGLKIDIGHMHTSYQMNNVDETAAPKIWLWISAMRHMDPQKMIFKNRVFYF